MDTLPLVLFTLLNESYAIPANQVREIVRSEEITPLPQAHAFIEGVLNLRGRMMAVIDLKKRFELGTHQEKGEIIVVRIPNALVGLMVDKVEDVIHVSCDLIQEMPPHATSRLNHNFIFGILQQTEGHSVLVLNVQAIFSMEEAAQLSEVHMDLKP